MRQVFRSPAFAVLIALGLFNAVGSLWFSTTMFGTPTYPVTCALMPILVGSFSIIPLIIAIYYAGELVWRERDRKMHEIIDATPLPNWAYVVPKTLAVALVLVATVADQRRRRSAHPADQGPYRLRARQISALVRAAAELRRHPARRRSPSSSRR